jgi:hypothetical protein
MDFLFLFFAQSSHAEIDFDHAHFKTAEAYFLNQTSFHHAETGFF